jgi:hypothetical protein
MKASVMLDFTYTNDWLGDFGYSMSIRKWEHPKTVAASGEEQNIVNETTSRAPRRDRAEWLDGIYSKFTIVLRTSV